MKKALLFFYLAALSFYIFLLLAMGADNELDKHCKIKVDNIANTVMTITWWPRPVFCISRSILMKKRWKIEVDLSMEE